MSLRSKPFCSGVPGARFSKVLKCFRTRPKAAADSQTLGLQSCNEAWVKRGPGTKSFKGTLQDSCNAIKLEPESKKNKTKKQLNEQRVVRRAIVLFSFQFPLGQNAGEKARKGTLAG